jgi:hypothetical protein
LTPDPDQVSAFDNFGDPQAWNGYAYARNNPLRYTDPDGQEYLICDEKGENCSHQSDQQFDKNKNSNGEVWKDGKIFVPDGNGGMRFGGTYVDLGQDIPGDPQQNLNSAGMIGVGGERFIAAFAKQAIIAGVTGGAGSAFAGGLVEGLGVVKTTTSVLGLEGTADAANAYATLSVNSIKHLAAHLDEFQALDPALTVGDQAKIGYDIIKTGTQVGARVYEGTATIGGQTVTVRAVVGGTGQLRSVYIPH